MLEGDITAQEAVRNQWEEPIATVAVIKLVDTEGVTRQ